MILNSAVTVNFILWWSCSYWNGITSTDTA